MINRHHYGVSNELVYRYIQLISNFYPGRGDAWGIYGKSLGIYTEERVTEFVQALENIRNQLVSTHNKELKIEYKNLIYNINLRLFEICDYQYLSRTCSFYTDSIFMTLYDSLHFSDDKEKNHELFKKRMNFFEIACSNAESNFDIRYISKLDCIIAMNESRSIFESLNKKVGNLITDKDRKVFNKYIGTLVYMRERSKHILLPYSSQQFSTNIKLLTGIKNLNLDYIYKMCLKNLENDVYDKEIEKSLTLNISMVYEYCNKIISECAEEYVLQKEFIESFTIKEYRGEYKNTYVKIEKAAYSALGMNDNREKPELIVNIEGIQFESELILSIIHEIMGHHWLAYHEKEKWNTTVTSNEIFDEGWARYCEYYFIQRINSNKNLESLFNRKMRKSFIHTYIAINSYYYKIPQNTIFHALTSQFKLSSKEAKNAIISVLLKPFVKTQYAIGFLLFQDKLGSLALRDISKYVIESKHNFEALDLLIHNGGDFYDE